MKRNMTLLLAVMVFISCIFAGCGKNATDDKDITKYYKYLSSSEYNLCVDTVKAIDDYSHLPKAIRSLIIQKQSLTGSPNPIWTPTAIYAPTFLKMMMI